MNHNYDVLSPGDYLNLIYRVFFDWAEFPKPTNGHERFVTALEGLLLAAGVDVLLGLALKLSIGRFAWPEIAFGSALGILIGVTSTIAPFGIGFPRTDVQRRLDVRPTLPFNAQFLIAAALAGSLAGGLIGSVAGAAGSSVTRGSMFAVELGLVTCLLVTLGRWAAGGISYGLSRGVVRGIPLCVLFSALLGTFISRRADAPFEPPTTPRVLLILALLYGVIGAVEFVFARQSRRWAFAFMVAMGTILAGASGAFPQTSRWQQMLSNIGLAALCSALAFLCALVANKASDANSLQADLWVASALLVILSLSAQLLLSSAELRLGLEQGPPFLIGGTIVLMCTQFPVFLLELLWGPLVMWRSGGHSLAASDFASIIRRAYFDRHMLIPIPGEVDALRRLAEKNHDYAVQETISLATSSAHVVTSVYALRDFACSDPLGVQAQILSIADTNAREQLMRYIEHSLPDDPKRAWRAQQQVAALANRLGTFVGATQTTGDGESIPATTEADPNTGTSLGRANSEEGLVSAAVNILQRAVTDLQLAQQQPDQRMRHVEEVSRVYGALGSALEAKRIEEIGDFSRPRPTLVLTPLIPLQLGNAFTALDKVAETLREYAAATSPVTRRNELLKANERLEVAGPEIGVLPNPYGPIIWLLIRHWRQMLVAAGGRLARADSSGPIPNPYVIGNPVKGSSFIGREEVMRRLKELWGPKEQCPSVVLYGHRRMGKSSILQNLATDEYFTPDTIIVDLNMQRIGRASSTGELLFILATKMYDCWRGNGDRTLQEPAKAEFLEDPYLTFDRFLSRLGDVRRNHRFIIAVDEFEKIEEQMVEGRLEPGLLENWRATFMTYPWFIMAFAGLHTLEEMREDYWNPLFGSVTAIEVTFLSPEAARRLITEPTPNFAINYDPRAVEQIIELTNGQPYVVQLICHALVARFNRKTFEAGIESERRFSVDDIASVIDAPEFYRDGDAYFTGIWAQAEASRPAEQTAILKSLRSSPKSLDEIATDTSLSTNQVRAALNTLHEHAVIAQRDGKYVYTVELMRRWVERREND